MARKATGPARPGSVGSGSGSGAGVVLYAVDLDELRRWVGGGDLIRAAEAWRAVQEGETDWEPEERTLLQRLVHRVVTDGQLYAGLPEEERYYLTQLLIDLFDEYVDQEALSEDLPLDRLLQSVDELRLAGEGARLAQFLLRGRELDGERHLWEGGPAADVLAYFGYVSRAEAKSLATALDEALRRSRARPGGLVKQLRNAAEECARSELDLLSFVG